MSFPTGSIQEKDVTPMSMGQQVRLPYPMQLGSGTYDLLPGLTYIGRAARWQWGLHASGAVRLGENDHDYRLGHHLSLAGGLPVYETLTGPQLSTAWRLTAAWEWTFSAPLALWD